MIKMGLFFKYLYIRQFILCRFIPIGFYVYKFVSLLLLTSLDYVLLYTYPQHYIVGVLASRLMINRY